MLVHSLFPAYHEKLSANLELIGHFIYRKVYNEEQIEFMNRKEHKKYFITMSFMKVTIDSNTYTIPSIKRRYSAHSKGRVHNPNEVPITTFKKNDVNYDIVKNEVLNYDRYRKAKGNFLYSIYTYLNQYRFTNNLLRDMPIFKEILELAFEERYHNKTVSKEVAQKALIALNESGFQEPLSRFGFRCDQDLTVDLDVGYEVMNGFILKSLEKSVTHTPITPEEMLVEDFNVEEEASGN